MTTGDRFMPANTRLFSSASDSLMGETIKREVQLSRKYAYFVTERGVNQIRLSDFTVQLLTPENTHNRLSNRSYIGVDSNQNLVAITPVSRRSGGYNGAFPLHVFGRAVIDEESLTSIEYAEFSFKGSGEYLQEFYGNEGIIRSNQGLYHFNRGELEQIPIKGINLSQISTIRKSGRYLWISFYNQGAGCDVHCFDRKGNLVHTVKTCNQSTTDLEGNLYYYHGSTYRIHKYSPVTQTDETLNDPTDVLRWAMFTNAYGDIYAMGVGQARKIFIQENNSWSYLSDFFSLENNNKQPKVDRKGRFWLNSSAFVSVVDPCGSVQKPVLTISKSGEETLIKAEGCQSTIWSWENPVEKVHDHLTKSNNTLKVENSDLGAVYTAKCYDKGCVGEEDALKIDSKYYLQLRKAGTSQALCKGMTLLFETGGSGNFPQGSAFALVLENNKNKAEFKYATLPDFLEINTNGLVPGKYTATLYEINSIKISTLPVEIEIYDAPIVKITGKNVICKGTEDNRLYLEISGGLEPYAISWTADGHKTPETAISYPVTSASEIQGWVEDKNGCIVHSGVIRVNEVSAPDTEVRIFTSNDMKKTLSVIPVSGQNYQWYLNDQIVNGATGNSIMAEHSGSYKIEVTNKGCSVVSAPVEIEMVLANEIPPSLSIFPNPGQDHFFIEAEVAKNDRIEVVDEAGRVVWSKKFNKNERSMEKVNVGKWPAGVYTVIHKASKQPRVFKKFVKA